MRSDHGVNLRSFTVFCVILLILVGMYLRSLGIFADFWGDEAWWAIRLKSESVTGYAFRPVAYMWLSKQFGELGGSDLWYRFFSYSGGVGALVFLYFSANRLYQSTFAAVSVLLLAVFNPYLVVYAKEFKPYSLEVFIHAILFYWVIVCYEKDKVTIGFIFACAISILFCYNIVFFFPAIAFAFFYKDLLTFFRGALRICRERPYVVLILVLSTIVFLHLYFYSVFVKIENSRYFWGEKYDTFPVGIGVFSSVVWYVEKTLLLLQAPSRFEGRVGWLDYLFSMAFVISYIFGVYNLVSSGRIRLLTLLLGTIVMVLVANLLWLWPYGDFRTNLFVQVTVLLVFGLGFDYLLSIRLIKPVVTVFSLLVFLNIGLNGLSAYKNKLSKYGAPSPQHTEVIRIISDRINIGEKFDENILLSDWHTWKPVEYYLRYSAPKLSVVGAFKGVHVVKGKLNQQDEILLRIENIKDRVEREGKSARVWVVVTQLKRYTGLDSNPLLNEKLVFKEAFSLHDPDYHPVVYELHY